MNHVNLYAQALWWHKFDAVERYSRTRFLPFILGLELFVIEDQNDRIISFTAFLIRTITNFWKYTDLIPNVNLKKFFLRHNLFWHISSIKINSFNTSTL